MATFLQNHQAKTQVISQVSIGQYLTFLVAGENFAVSILDVKEIIEISNITNVPLTPDFIYGVINLRGNVVPIIDLSAKLKHIRTQISKRSCIVLVAIEIAEKPQLIGMLVDEVREILEIPTENIKPAPDFGTDIHTDFIKAMAEIDNVFIILLAINHVLSLAELSQINSMAAKHPTAVIDPKSPQ